MWLAWLSGLFLIAPISAAQRPHFEMGPLLDAHKGQPVVALFGHDNSFFYTLRQDGRGMDQFILEKISVDSLRPQNQAAIHLGTVKGMSLVLAYPLSMAQQSYLIATASSEASDSLYIFSLGLSPELQLHSPRLLATASKTALLSQGGFSTYMSADQQLLALLLPAEPNPGRNEKFELRLLDRQLSLLERRFIELPHYSENVEIIDAVLDSTESIFLLAATKGPQVQGLSEKENLGQNFGLFKYRWKEGSMNEKSLSLGNKWLYDLKLFLNLSDHVQIAGYYSNMIDPIMAGTFSLEIDAQSGDVLHQGLSPFDRDLRTRFRPRDTGLGKTELGKYDLDYVLPLRKEAVQLVSEKNYIHTSTVFNPMTGAYSLVTVHNFDEILLTTINPSSKILDTQVIPKFQSSQMQESDFTSYICYTRGGQTVLVYNDHERNKTLALSEQDAYRQITSPSNTQAVMVVLTPDQEPVKTPLFTSDEKGVTFNPLYMYKTDSSTVLIATNGYRNRFFKLSSPASHP